MRQENCQSMLGNEGTEMQNPAATTFTAPKTVNSTNGFLTGGFGFINYVGGSTFIPPRQGTLEARFQF